jgi:formylmethanofuran dehydrogenase subunit C
MIRLTLKAEPPVRIKLGAVLPERLAGLSIGEIERLPLTVGNRREAVGDWFRVAPGAGEALAIDGPCRRVDEIGAGMTGGAITLHGDAGAYLGLGMQGGGVTIEGSAGFGAATALRGGSIRIRGDAGDGLGGSLPGADSGMRAGTVLVAGNVGAEAGQRLRRGLIVIGGNAGPACGAGMIAGTVVVGGKLGAHPGTAMRRGSIIALGGAARISPSFVDCGVHDLLFVRLLSRHLASLGEWAIAHRLTPLRRWMGDAAFAGNGELLLPS